MIWENSISELKFKMRSTHRLYCITLPSWIRYSVALIFSVTEEAWDKFLACFAQQFPHLLCLRPYKFLPGEICADFLWEAENIKGERRDK